MKILVTGFAPFGGERINPSWEAVRRLPDRIGEAALFKREIPTEFDASATALRAAIAELRPDAVLCVGQYGGAPSMSLALTVQALTLAVEILAAGGEER